MGKGIEINTGGFKYGLGHPNPCEDILKRYRSLGGEKYKKKGDINILKSKNNSTTSNEGTE